VIAIGRKSIDLSSIEVQRIERENVESELEFLGLIILENRLKPESAPTIKILKSANIRTIMCTGDNILTGLSVARDCGMINEKQKIILVDAESGQEPKFSNADIKRQNKEKSEKSEIHIEEVI
jgi:cation-transporting ATPase 13A2